MKMENKPASKLEIFNFLLAKGSVFVHLVGTECTSLPAYLLKQEQVILQFGLDLAVPIPDLLVTEQGVNGTLSFKGKPEHVTVPWYAVYALVGEDSKGIVYPEIMPASVKREIEAGFKPVAEKPKTPDYRTLNKTGTFKRPNHLRLVK